MPFHRLAAATYFGVDGDGLLAGFDKLNDPQNGGPGTGIPTPADSGAKSGGIYDGVYFVAASETANAFNVNRGMRALGDNTDFLDDLLRRDIAVTVRDEVSSGHGGSSTHDLDGSTDNVHVGSSTLGSPPLVELFSITDPTGEAPIFVGGNKVVVSSISPDNRGVSDGFDSANPLTLTLSATIPDSQAFRVYYGIRRNLATLPENAFTFMDILRATEASGSASGTVVDDANLTAVALSDIDAKSGGVGNPISTSQEALDNIDLRLTKLRGFVATISDGTGSLGGDIESATIDSVVNNASSTLKGGLFSVRAGTYDVTANWDLRSSFVSGTDGAVTFRVGAGAGADVSISGGRLEGITIDTASAARRWNVTGDFFMDGGWKAAGVGAGSLRFNGASADSQIELRHLTWIANTDVTSASVAGLEVTGSGQVRLIDCDIDLIPANATTKTATFYMHTFSEANSHAVIEKCRFKSDQSGADAVFLENVQTRVVFKNCLFETLNGSADAWAVRLMGCFDVVFENCKFIGFEGQCVKSEGSSATFRDCAFVTGAGTALSNPQALVGSGASLLGASIGELCIERCSLSIGSSNIDATGAPTQAIVELGGLANAQATSGRTFVDGLDIINTASGTHNYSTVLLHGYGGANTERNIYKNIMYDADDVDSDSTGTLSNFSGGASVGMLVEIVGTATTPKTIVENLSIINVKDPAVSHTRSVVSCINCTVRTFHLEGSSVAGAGVYNQQLVEFNSCDVSNLQWFIQRLIRTDGTLGICDFVGATNIDGGRIRTHTYSGFNTVFNGDQYCRLTNLHIHVESTTGLASSVVDVDDRSVVVGNTIVSEQTSGQELLDSGQGQGCTVTGNLLYWRQSGGTIAIFAGDSVVTGNIFGTAPGVTIPSVTYPGGSGVGDDTLNVRAVMTLNVTHPGL